MVTKRIVISVLFAIILFGSSMSFKAYGEVFETRQAEKWAVEAYRHWMMKELSDTVLARKIFTDEMREKAMRAGVGYDYLTRAQDVTDYGISSLKCRHITDDWYAVSFQWNETDEPEVIPIRLKKTGDDYRISYILPEWVTSIDYKKLFDVVPCDTVNRTDAFKFVETFYCNYTHLYAEMLPDLQRKLSEMRSRYCTEEFIKRINAEKDSLSIYDMDSYCYDAIIMGCDFDITQINSLNVTRLSDTKFKVSYNLSSDKINLTVETLLCEDGWRISNISL